MGIENEVAKWNGKSADDIAAVFQRHHDRPDFADNLVRLAAETHSQKGATWLLKAYLEAGNTLSKDQAGKVYRLLDKLESWQAKLHVLQSMPFMPVAKSEVIRVEAFLRGTLADSNKFVRAWSYNGFYELARQYPEYREEVSLFLDMAMRDEAASVKARVRNILKEAQEEFTSNYSSK